MHDIKYINETIGISNKEPICAYAVGLAGDDRGSWQNVADGFGSQIKRDDGIGFINDNQDGEAGFELQVFDADRFGQVDGGRDAFAEYFNVRMC